LVLLTIYDYDEQIKRGKKGGACSKRGKRDMHLRLCSGKIRSKAPLGRPRSGYWVNIKLENKEIGKCAGRDSYGSGQE
jgi:hypothetical protein